MKTFLEFLSDISENLVLKENDQVIRDTAKMFIDYIDEKTMESKSQQENEPKTESLKSWFGF
jgi:hypothetical protein